MLFKIIFVFLICISNVYARQIIIDTDVGVDDVIALAYMLNNPDIQVSAITIAGDGNSHCLPALHNTLGILQILGKKAIPVACGREKPLSGTHHFPKYVYRESDTLENTSIYLRHAQYFPAQSAVQLLKNTLQLAAKPLDILAIGPLTNIAEVLRQQPKLKNKIHMIYFMGGAVNVPGNIPEVVPQSKNTTAEWNVYLDPLAASIVFRSGVPMTLVSLDVTNQLPITQEFYLALKQKNVIPYIAELFKHKMQHPQGWYFWDPLAAVIARDESIATMKNLFLRVVLMPESQSGALRIDNKHGNKIRICVAINKKRFHQELLNGLSQKVSGNYH